MRKTGLWVAGGSCWPPRASKELQVGRRSPANEDGGRDWTQRSTPPPRGVLPSTSDLDQCAVCPPEEG